MAQIIWLVVGIGGFVGMVAWIHGFISGEAWGYRQGWQDGSIAGQSTKPSSQERRMCNCPYPIQVGVQDVLVSQRPKKNGLVTVDRYCDCMFCGPSVERVDILPAYNKHGQLVIENDWPGRWVEPVAKDQTGRH